MSQCLCLSSCLSVSQVRPGREEEDNRGFPPQNILPGSHVASFQEADRGLPLSRLAPRPPLTSSECCGADLNGPARVLRGTPQCECLQVDGKGQGRVVGTCQASPRSTPGHHSQSTLSGGSPALLSPLPPISGRAELILPGGSERGWDGGGVSRHPGLSAQRSSPYCEMALDEGQAGSCLLCLLM